MYIHIKSKCNLKEIVYLYYSFNILSSDLNVIVKLMIKLSIFIVIAIKDSVLFFYFPPYIF